MENKKIKNLENFANDFNKRLQLSELEPEDNGIFKKLNNNNIINKRNKLKEFNSLSTRTIRSKSQFRPVINIIL